MYELRLNAKEHEKFVKLMRKKCDKRKITLEQLAGQIDVSPRSIYNFISDSSRNPSRFLAAKIANELDIKPTDVKSKKSAFFVIPLAIGLGIALIPKTAKAESTDIDFSKYIEKENVLDEVYGVEYPTNFTLGYQEDAVIVDDNIPLEDWEQAEIQRICEKHNLCYELVLAIIETESMYKSDATNGDCKGIMQINTAVHDISNPYDTLENIEVGCTMLENLFKEHEDVALVLDLYSGNPNAYSNYENGVISSYARKIIERSEELEQSHNK